MNPLFQGLLNQQQGQPNGMLWQMLGQQQGQQPQEAPQQIPSQQESLLNNPVFTQALFKMGAILGQAGQEGTGTVPALALAGNALYDTVNQSNNQRQRAELEQLQTYAALQNSAVNAQEAQAKQEALNSGAFVGTSLEAQAANAVLGQIQDPAQREAARQQIARSQLLKPQLQMVQNPDGTTQLMAIKPDIPFLQQPQGVLANVGKNPKKGQRGGILSPEQQAGGQDPLDVMASQNQNAPYYGILGDNITPVGAPAPQKLTEKQMQVKALIGDSINSLNDFLNVKQPSNKDMLLNEVPVVGNALITTDSQKSIQAGKVLQDNLLKLATGAGQTLNEARQSTETLLPSPFEDVDTRKQKIRTMFSKIKEWSNAAGQGVVDTSFINALEQKFDSGTLDDTLFGGGQKKAAQAPSKKDLIEEAKRRGLVQ